MITFKLSEMNAIQLAKLYKFLVNMWRMNGAALVYAAGVANCGEAEFCYEVARA